MTTGAGDWHEVGRQVFRRRFEPCDITITAVLGEEGVAVVDTRCSLAEARELKELIGRLTPLPIRWVVNTHAHYDHTWGNAEFTAPRLDPPARIFAHPTVPGRLRLDEPRFAELLTILPKRSPDWPAKLAELEFAKPTELVADSTEIDLGGRTLELRHVGRGHTDGDLWVRIPDAAVVLSGDQVEQSGPPAFGRDCFPLDWPASLDRALAWVGPDAVIVPGHGEPVDRAFVIEQRALIQEVGDETARLYAAGIALEDAVAEGSWPIPAGQLRDAVTRGYAALEDSGEA